MIFPLHIKQPEKSSLCGQCCVAMVLGISLEESIKLFKKTSATRTRDVCKALGIDFRPLNRSKELPDIGILKITWRIDGKKLSFGHWILKVGDVIFDPSFDYAVSFENHSKYLSDVGGKITSSLSLKGAIP